MVSSYLVCMQAKEPSAGRPSVAPALLTLALMLWRTRAPPCVELRDPKWSSVGPFALFFGGVLCGALLVLVWLRLRRRSRKVDVDVVALFCNPRLPRSFGLQSLSFGQDYKFLMRMLPRGSLYVEPAASLYTTRRALVHHRPRFLMFSGHSAGGAYLMFETPDGQLDGKATTRLLAALLRDLCPESPPPTPSELGDAVAVEAHLGSQEEAALAMQHCGRAWMEAAASERAVMTQGGDNADLAGRRGSWLPACTTPAAFAPASHAALSRLGCVLINACKSVGVGRKIVHALPPGVAVVCWSTLTEDAAARAFMVGFMTHVANARERASLVPTWRRGAEAELQLVRAAFAAGCASFKQAGYHFGDPESYFHPPGHEHWMRPQFATCKQCAPPVHGEVVLLTLKRAGGLEEVYGHTAMMSADRRSFRRRWRVLLTGVKLAERSDWSTTNESVRDLHRGLRRELHDEQCAPVVHKQRSADDLPIATASTRQLHHDVGTASELAQPGGFRRAHVRGTTRDPSSPASPNLAHAKQPLSPARLAEAYTL